ncbi:FAD-dependent monooxygenase [Arcticibacter eurypsychrophilus]|uniref:FAD-dependent monooxygenase n=1 Tax=Arcticibacter eurypsychrophilus TaxID=1434752 RepID=UPI00084D77B4|nr:FAD-dependent monooxygenase [Arcticibacter eurypsychrophilus]
MINLPEHSTVVIVGAGPSGLMMAAQLLRYGIQPVIIDAKKELTRQSRALVLHSRSLEVFRALGLDGALLKTGNRVRGINFHEDNTKLDLSINDETLYPFMLVLEQGKTEKVLLEDLTAHACPVYWNTSLLETRQTDHQVSLSVNQEGAERDLTCDWLIAADGISSKVRALNRIHLSGSSKLHHYFLADLKLTADISWEFVYILSKKEGFLEIIPLNDHQIRCIGIIPNALNPRENLSFEDIRPYITFILGVPLQVDSCSWFSTYHVNHCMAERFRSRRTFLIGDAAHHHSPLGAQGMNSGLQDAANLAWKLAGVLNQEFNSSILDTYARERMPVAKGLLRTTDRFFNLLTSDNYFIKAALNGFIRERLMQFIGHPASRKWVLEKISQLSINYRNSKLSVHHSNATHVRAGDRLPFLPVFDEKIKESTDLHTWCSKLGFTLLVIGELNSRSLGLLAKWIKRSYPFNLNFYYLPPSESNKSIFEIFEIKENTRKAIIVRPDLYIGYIHDVVDLELIDVYLKEVIGWRKF